MLLYPKTTLKNRIAFTPSPRYFQLWIMVFLFFLMLLSGGLNSSNYAGYVCEAFPFCNANSSFSFFIKNKNIFFNAWQGISLQLNLLEVIHLFHRLVVILGSFYLIYIAIFYWMKDAKIWKILGYSLLALLLRTCCRNCKCFTQSSYSYISFTYNISLQYYWYFSLGF